MLNSKARSIEHGRSSVVLVLSPFSQKGARKKTTTKLSTNQIQFMVLFSVENSSQARLQPLFISHTKKRGSKRKICECKRCSPQALFIEPIFSPKLTLSNSQISTEPDTVRRNSAQLTELIHLQLLGQNLIRPEAPSNLQIYPSSEDHIRVLASSRKSVRILLLTRKFCVGLIQKMSEVEESRDSDLPNVSLIPEKYDWYTNDGMNCRFFPGHTKCLRSVVIIMWKINRMRPYQLSRPRPQMWRSAVHIRFVITDYVCENLVYGVCRSRCRKYWSVV